MSFQAPRNVFHLCPYKKLQFHLVSSSQANLLTLTFVSQHAHIDSCVPHVRPSERTMGMEKGSEIQCKAVWGLVIQPLQS